MFGAKDAYQYFSVSDSLLLKQAASIEVFVEGSGNPDLFVSQNTVYPTLSSSTWSSLSIGAQSLYLNVSAILSIPLNIGISNYIKDG
jgi:hypothetical protein